MNILRLPALLLIAILVAGLFAACDGGDDNEPTATSTSAAAEPTATSDGTGADPTATPQSEPTSTEPPEPTATAPATATPPAATATPTTEPEPTATEAEELTLNVYFIRDEHLTVGHRTIPHTLMVGTAAMEALLEGPTDYEAELGFTSAIPEGTELLDLTVENGIATVDLSAAYESGGGSFSVMARLAQVIFTLTQFPTVDAVEFLLDGEPVEVFSGEGVVIDGPAGRDFEDFQPPIFVESVAVGDTITSPVLLSGTANTFEATFAVRILSDDGGILTEQVVTATSGTGTRGTFETTVPFEVESETPGTVMVFEYSARDGSPTNIIEIPVILQP